MKKILFFLTLSAALTQLSLRAQQESRLLRFPAIYGNRIVFSYAGDLYTVDGNGGIARKLTSDIGYEMFPRFSPDGTQIAFTGQYDGNTEVFVMPAEGGTPKRLTYTATLSRDDVSDRMGPNNIVMDWTPDGKYITYRSRKQSFNSFIGQLFRVPAEGGISEELPLPYGGFCSYSPDGSRLAYNRIFREFRTWKYYRGGMADEIWIHDFNSKETTKITDNNEQDIIPMWTGSQIFYLSDRDHTMNVFVYNTDTKETKKVTNFTGYDVKFPSLGKDQIVFENGGYIYKLDVNTGDYEKVSVIIANDNAYSRTELKDASETIRTADLSPNGERVVFGARGEIFTVPAKNGITRNLTQSSGAHDRDAVWSPDGRYIAYFSDRTGEYELYIQKEDGSENAVQLTSGTKTYLYELQWSPDSKKILFSDREFRLQYVDTESKKVTLVKKSKSTELNDFGWSPDSKWIAFTDYETNLYSVVNLYNMESGKIYPVTDKWYYSRNPVFSPDGKYLYFTSSRDFNPTYSETEWNHSYNDMTRVYLAILAADTPSPFAPENDEVMPEGEEDEENGNDSGKDVRIDTEGLTSRILSLPVRASNYYNLESAPDRVYYLERHTGNNSLTAKVFDLKKKKESDLGSNLRFTISANHKKMLVRQNGKYAVIDLPSGQVTIEESLDLSNMKVLTDYRKEWQQIFDESWRQMRDFFYIPNMHGVDWQAMYDKYAVLVPYVNHRDDLTYVIGEMIGELNTGHTYVLSGSDRPRPERIPTGLLGAKISKHESGYFRIDEILEGANWSEALRSPLTEIGLNIKEGDIITAVNGQSTRDMDDIYAALVGTAGKTVELTVNGSAAAGGRSVLVTPIAGEQELYYYKWVQGNIKKVDEATDGQIGYIHIRDMGPTGLNDFASHFYPQLFDKKGLIIDDRGNGGGNVSPMIIERLRRVMTHSDVMRGRDFGTPNPGAVVLGPKVMLINYASASDGDLFPYQFKTLKLGTLIGTRTWGGVVGIRGSLPFIDGGDLRKPEFANYSGSESKWIIENKGVEPDIYIDNDPSKEYEGEDEQLDKAIEVILQQLDQYTPVPAPPEPSVISD